MTEIAIPDLDQWVKQHVTAMYKATTREEFQEAFNDFLTKDANITVNSHHMSREKYMNLLMNQKSMETGADMHFYKTVSVPAGNDMELTGEVGTAFKATIGERIAVGGLGDSRTVDSTMNVTVREDKSIPKPHVHGRGGGFDARRVFAMNEVTTAMQNSTLPPPPALGGASGAQ